MKNPPVRKMDSEQAISSNGLKEAEYQGYYKEMNAFR